MAGVYIPGSFPPVNEPLSRFLPPIPDGAASAWLQTNAPLGAWVLDPFGTSPRLAVEMARCGYRVLVTANNPIIRFLLEMAAAPPTRQEMQTSLAELASAYRGEERIEPLLRSLYQTECASCGTSIMAEAFLWENADGGKSAASAPYARIYTCPNCHDSGEHHCNQADITRAAQFDLSSLHRARALERVAPHNDPDRPYAEQAINVYLPRAVYGLFTLINKFDGLEIPVERRRHLAALLLHACYQANTMWKHPAERERRYQLVIPPRFREQNIWLALEQGIDLWSAERLPGDSTPVPLYSWPPPEGESLPPNGIWLFEGRLRSLAESLSSLGIRAVCTALPRPNRAFWTLSALWAGWLWGYEAVGPFRSVLRRQRYDWAWHTSALTASLTYLGDNLAPNTPVFGLVGEYEPNYLAAVLVAADIAGFKLESCAIRTEIAQAQFTWSREGDRRPSSGSDLEKIAVQKAIRFLEERGEPASFPFTFSAAMIGAAEEHYFYNAFQRAGLDESLENDENAPSDIYSQASSTCKEILGFRYGFLRYSPLIKGKSDPAQPQFSLPDNAAVETEAAIVEKEKPAGESSESGFVWLRDPSQAAITPLADRIEIALVNYLLKHPGCSTAELDTALCAEFRGLFTPDTEFLHINLDSYAELDVPPQKGWNLHPQDRPSARRIDLDEAEQLIHRLGDRLGFTTQVPSVSKGDQSNERSVQCWLDRNSQPQYWIYPIASAVIGEIILQSQVPAGKGLIILPGGRANLVAYKLRRDPRLSRLCDPGGWRLIKYRHLRWLESNPLLSRENLDEQLSLDPLTYATPQLRLL